MSYQPGPTVRAIRIASVSALMALPAALMLLVLIWLGSTIQAQPSNNGKGDYCPLLPGTRWQFRFKIGDEVKGSVTETVADIETVNDVALARLEAEYDGNIYVTEHLHVAKDGVYRYRIRGMELSKPMLALRYPVKDNDSWEFTTKVGNHEAKGTVTTRFEEVEVPAGKFKALATEINAEVDGRPLRSTIWFVEGVGKVKQILEYGGLQYSVELEKFTPGKAQP